MFKLEDFRPTAWRTPKVNLLFDLHPRTTIVRATYEVEAVGDVSSELFLNGEGLEFLKLRINGDTVPAEEYEISPLGLKILHPPSKSFQLTVENKISPETNTSLEGLYRSGSMLCTQNEPEGFRKIVYSIDRPDNMMVFTVTLVGNPDFFPVLLSNGNFVSETLLSPEKKQVVWFDPFPKPSYLFCLVAGDLILSQDSYKTKSGKYVELRIYVEKGNEAKVSFAFESLKKAFLWDEETFDLEYDLDLFMIVAVEDFNMGAMENKGLNLFNAKLVLCDKSSATDESFESIMAVIAHEYFHNWTGNRVTLKNWFNLTLKEGLTVFRDQWFTEDQTDPAVKRIKDVLFLKEYQFVEDQGPMSHPILPKSYVEMNNFYTVTVYEKGAEVIRLLSSLVGRETFKKGLKHYLSKYDGQGVTFEEFIDSIEEIYGSKILYIRNWYHRKGTPTIKVEEHYDPNTKVYSLEFTDLGGQEFPLVFMNQMALFSKAGKLIEEINLEMVGERTQFTKNGLSEKPIVSLFRNFSSPVNVLFERAIEEEILLAEHETEGVSKFFAFQNVIFELFRNDLSSETLSDLTPIFQIIQSSINGNLDPSYLSYYLSFPTLTQIADAIRCYDYELIQKKRILWISNIAERFENEFLILYSENRKNLPDTSKESIAKRRLKNLSLNYLIYTPGKKKEYEKVVKTQISEAKHMSEELPALKILVETESADKEEEVQKFYEKWKQDSIVLDSWFSLQVGFGENREPLVKKLEQHSKFTIQNPNKVRSLYFSFAKNPLSFHKTDGSGYELIEKRIQSLNSVNAQMAAGLTKLFQSAFLQNEDRKFKAIQSLNRIKSTPNLSKEVGEVLNLLLGSS